MRVVNIKGQKFSCRTIALALFVCTLAKFAGAVQLLPIPDISQTPLELTPTVNANVMILFDDSGSMDFEVMTSDAISSGLFFAPDPDGTDFGSTDPALQIIHRDISGSSQDCRLITAAFGGYAYGIAAPSNHYVDDTGNDCYVADENSWRFRCSSFNKLYYDPAVVYAPWVGVRSDGMAYSAVPINTQAAPLDPFDANSPTVNLESPESFTEIDKFRYFQCGRNPSGTGPFELVPNSEVEIGVGSSELSNFYNWFVYHRSRHLRAKALLGKFIESQTGTNIGLVRFNFSSSPSLPAEEMNQSVEEDEKLALLNALYSTNPNQLPGAVEFIMERSPLHKRYIETARYLECSGGDSDVFPGLNLGSPGSPNCPAETGPAGGVCQANHIIVATDAFVDRFPFSGFSGGAGFGNEDGDNDTLFDGGAFADSFSRTFSDIAISFYEDDLLGAADEVPVEPVDRDRYPTDSPELEPEDTLHQHIKTHVITYDVTFSDPDPAPPNPALSLTNKPSDPMASFPWSNRLETDFGLLQDLVHAAYSGRGQYIDTTKSSTSELDNLTQAIATGVGSTTPVAINTQSAEQSAVLYRTFYDSSSISGDVVAQRINPDGTLEEDSNGDPVFMWSAAEQIDDQLGPDEDNFLTGRNIITYFGVDIVNPGRRFIFSGANSIEPSQQSLLNLPLPAVGENRLNYLRGDTENESPDGDNFRIRPETTSTGGGVIHFAKLGTVANAAPIFVGTPPASGRFGGLWPSTPGRTYFDFQTDNADRDPSLLVAANDGMFHVFDADDGSERFAYVPEIIFDQLSKLTDPDYKHQYYVDSTPSVNDAYLNGSCSGLSPCWNTVVIGGLGAGGQGYYAIDITDPGNFSSEDSARDQVMWEFGQDDDPGPNGAIDSDLGLSFGRPLIAMSNVDDGVGNQRWVAVFGNGYNSGSTTGNAIIYMLFIDGGRDGVWSPTDFVKIDLGEGGVVAPFTTPNGIADVRAIDIDGNGTIDRLYAGDMRGNLHVVDVSDNNVNSWRTSNFILFEAEYSGTGQPQPITTRPVAVRNQNAPGFTVVFTTGSYFTKSDSTNTDIQSIYGIWDDGTSTTTISASDLQEQELSNETTTDGLEVRIVTDNPVTLGTAGTVNNEYRGWFIDFDVPPQGLGGGVEFPGERAVRALQLRGSVLFVNTVIPQIASCDPSAGGFGLGLDPFTGSDGDEVIFDINIDNVFDDNDSIEVVSDIFKIVVGTRFKSIPSDSSFFGDYRITQLANTDIDSIRTNVGNADFIGRQSWREVEY